MKTRCEFENMSHIICTIYICTKKQRTEFKASALQIVLISEKQPGNFKFLVQPSAYLQLF